MQSKINGKNKGGFINKKNELEIPYQIVVGGFFNKIFEDEDDSPIWAYVKKKGKEGIIDREGKVIFPFKYDSVFRFYKHQYNFAEVGLEEEIDEKWICKKSYIDRDFKEVLPCIYDEVSVYKENDKIYFKVKLDGKGGFLDLEGNEIYPHKYEYDNMNRFYDGIAQVGLNKKYGFINTATK